MWGIKHSIVNMVKITRLLSLFIFLQSCAQLELPPKQPLFKLSALTLENTGTFSDRPDILTPEQIHQLSQQQIDRFLTYMRDPRNQHIPQHRRLSSFLENETKAFVYEKNTLIAEQAMALNAGNCLSLAILTTALAKVADLEIAYQLMDDIPVYELNGAVINKGVHIRTILYDPTWVELEGFRMISKPGVKIDYFPTKRQRFIANVNENEYWAMYYRNIAAQAIGDEDYNTAYWYAMESLKFAPNNSPAINMLAVINRRAGDLEKAEELYLFGIEHADEKLSLLKNYHVLLTASDRTEDAALIEKQLDSMNDPSPFNWFQLARSAYDDGEYSNAIRYYKKAIELAPYLHEAHLGIAQANYEMGRLHNAEIALKAALDNVYKVSTRNLYQAKLASLSAEITN